MRAGGRVQLVVALGLSLAVFAVSQAFGTGRQVLLEEPLEAELLPPTEDDARAYAVRVTEPFTLASDARVSVRWESLEPVGVHLGATLVPELERDADPSTWPVPRDVVLEAPRGVPEVEAALSRVDAGTYRLRVEHLGDVGPARGTIRAVSGGVSPVATFVALALIWGPLALGRFRAGVVPPTSES